MCKALFLALAFIVPAAFAQPEATQSPFIEELRWVDNGYLARQRQSIDEITRGEFGSRLRGDKGDLRLLARILEEGLVNQTEKQKLQAMGVVLGDVFANELKMQWQVYRDADGKSRAVCLPEAQQCLFPVTMISKRMEVGVKPDVYELYERGVELIKPHLPKLPYSAD